MTSNINEKLLNFENDEFSIDYLELLTTRIAHSTMSLERDLGNPDDINNAVRLRDTMQAFRLLLNSIYGDRKLDEKLIKEVARIVNKSSIYISNDYRKIGKFLSDTDIPISKPEDITVQINHLIDDYYNKWNNLNSYEREAFFHIAFIRIHPFEDGNGRTSRLILNFNRLRNLEAPIVISSELIDEYYDCIKNNDVKKLANLFRVESVKEQSVMEQMYNEYERNKNR